ncbi:MAG: RluA family pseudouridine synthase [Candidatus Yonathbacteria bacterium]|nr:RluA family pseudouridine synthase [Candidatus Yonathbacteria bacterium]
MIIPILYEDDEVLALNKPAGLVVHSDGRTKEETLVDWISEQYPDIKERNVGEPIILSDGSEIKKYGIVHRLDRDTSGVILVAKIQESFLNLKMQFQSRGIKKKYKAIVYGFFKETHGTIDKPIARSASDFRRWSAEYGARGEKREAITEYNILQQGEVTVEGKKKNKPEVIKVSYIDIFPHTGRTHQIRVHFKAVGHPLVCDALYAPKMPCILGFKRTALHSSSIVFRGIDGVERKVEAPLPDDFSSALAKLNIL